jgi:hypothetical protein
MTRPIAAFSMEDYERLTRNAYQAAEFKRGKDKKKRKKRGLGFYAGVGAGGLTGAGALAAGARYGGAELGSRKAGKELSDLRMKTGLGGSVDPNESQRLARKMRGGAKGQLNRDVQAVKDFGSKVKNYDYKGIPGRVGEAAKNVAGKAGNAWMNSYGKLGLLGGGLATAGTLGALGAAGYGAYRMMNKKKKK